MWVGSIFSECIKQLVLGCSLYILTVLKIGDEDFSGVSSKEKRTLCLEVKQSKVRKQHKRFASLLRRETFEHSHLSFRTIQVALARRGRTEWLEGIEREFRYFRITEAVDKKDAIIIYGGKEIARLEKSLPDPETADVYLKLRTKLHDHFTPKKNKNHARYLFLKMRLHVGETKSAYAARLREKVKECEFGTKFDERILEHIIQTIDNKKLIEKAISKTLDLTRFLTEASQTEDIARQMRDMGSGQSNAEDISRVYAEQQEPKQEHGDGLDRTRRPGKKHKCQFCRLAGVHEKGKDCPAFGKKCHKCHKWNHFSSVCKSGNNRSYKHRKQKPGRAKKRMIKKTTADHAESTSSDDEFSSQAAKHLAQAKKIIQIGKDSGNYRTVVVRLNDDEACPIKNEV